MPPELLIDDHEFETPIYVSVAKFEEVRKFQEAQHRRDRRGRFAEKASVKLGDREITVVKPERAIRDGDKLVPLDVNRFDEEFQREEGFYIDVGGKGGIGVRYERFGQFIAENESIEAAEVYVHEDGKVGFINGRHRYAWLRDQGITSIPVAMSPESVANAKRHGYLSAVKKAWDESQPRDAKGRWTGGSSEDPPPVGPRIGFIAADGKEHVGRKTGGLGGYAEDHTNTARRLLGDEHQLNAIRTVLEQGYIRYWVRRGELALNFKAGHQKAIDNALKFLHDNYQEGDRIYLDVEDAGGTIGNFFDSLGAANRTIRHGLRKVAQEHAYGNTQIQISPHSSAALWLNMARDVIRDDHLQGTGKDVDPNHITVRYGLLNEDLDSLRIFIANQAPFTAYVGEIELFPASEHSDWAVPVVARIVAPELHDIEAEIGKHADFKEKSFPVYKPHCTLAYCKPEEADQYRKLFVPGADHGFFLVQSITISHQSGVLETIPFGLVQKWSPTQPRDAHGRFTDLGLHDGLVTVLHGTTRQNAEAILAGGFKAGDPARVAAEIERTYQLPKDSILTHVAFQFARGRRDLGKVHFTTDESVADQYSVPEVVQDALTSAHMLLHPTPEDVPFTKEMHAERKAWIDREARRLTEPALLAVTVPFETVGRHGFGKQFTLEEFKELLQRFPKAREDIFNNITIPLEALTGARIERRKWDASKHPRTPKGSSRGGEFMAVLHGPRDALNSLLNKEKDVSIDKNDVRAFLQLADEQHEDPDLTDLQVEGMEIFGGNGLGIERDDMPQIPPEHRQRFLEYAEEQGAKIVAETVDPLTLKPSQNAISARRVGEKLRKYERGDKKFPSVLVSKESRILDGHHHWGMMAAFALEFPDAKMPIFRLQLNAKQALSLMHAYMKIHGLKRATLSGAKVALDPASGRYVTPFVSFDKQGDEQLRMIASLNSSRLATWGFTAEAEVLGMARYRLTAVLDGRTSKFCRLMDGKVFEVSDARRKVIEALNVQNPEDLKVVQPWPKQTKAHMAMYAEMTTTDFVERGLHIPPYHPHCRTLLRHVPSSIGKPMEITPTVPEGAQVFQQVTQADLKELGIDATPEQVAEWNEHIGMTPVELLSKFSGLPPREVMTKPLGVGANPIQFDEAGNIGFKVRGETPRGVEFKLGALLDPFTGIYYLTQAELLAGTPGAELAFLKQMFSAFIDMGLKSSATSLALGVAGNAPYYARMGFLPDELEWNTLRMYALEGDTMIPTVLASLDPDDALLVRHLLQDKSVGAMQALVELPFSYQGKTIGEWLFGEATGTWALDLTDDLMVSQALAYLS